MTSTTNYGLFRTIQGNRQIDAVHVANLVAAIEKKNLLAEFPILVNEKMEVIDGQNRLLAATRLNLPIFYTVVSGLELTNVIDINTASKSWKIRDFVLSNIELGNPNYQELLDFSTEHNLSISMSAALLAGRGVQGGSIVKLVRTSKFQVNAPAAARRVAQALGTLGESADFRATSDRNLAMALWLLFQNEDFSIDRLIGKIKTHGIVLSRRVSERYYLLQLEEIYNQHAKDRVTLYMGQV